MMTQQEKDFWKAFAAVVGAMVTIIGGLVAMINNSLSSYSHALTIAEQMERRRDRERQAANATSEKPVIPKSFVIPEPEPVAQIGDWKPTPLVPPRLIPIPDDNFKPHAVVQAPEAANAPVSSKSTEAPRRPPTDSAKPHYAEALKYSESSRQSPVETTPRPYPEPPKLSEAPRKSTVADHALQIPVIRMPVTKSPAVFAMSYIQPSTVKTFEKHTTRRNHETYVIRQRIR